jgi:hypothetical protein
MLYADFDEEAIAREISESVVNAVKNSLRPQIKAPVQNGTVNPNCNVAAKLNIIIAVPIAKPATPDVEVKKADPPAKKAAAKKAPAKSNRSEVVKVPKLYKYMWRYLLIYMVFISLGKRNQKILA